MNYRLYVEGSTEDVIEFSALNDSIADKKAALCTETARRNRILYREESEPASLIPLAVYKNGRRQSSTNYFRG